MEWRALAAALLLCAPAAAGEPARVVSEGVLPCDIAREPRVVEVVGATSDAYEAAEIDGGAWIATSGGLVIVTEGRVARVITSLDGLPGSRLRSISVLPEGAYVGGVDGAALVTREGRVTRTFALPRVRRVALFRGARYAGAFGGGVTRLDEGGNPTPVAAIDARENVTDLVATETHLYVATAGAGVLRLDAQGRVDRTYRMKEGLADDVVWDLALDGSRILVATARGVSVIDGERVSAGARDLPQGDTRAVAVSGGETLVATFGGGAYRGRARLGRVTHVRSVTGNLIVHTEGVDRVDAAGHVVPIALGGLPSADVTSLARDGAGMWIGTFDHGLARLEAGVVVPVRAGVDPRVNDLAVFRDERGRETLLVATDGGLFESTADGFARVADAPREHTSAIAIDARTGDAWVAGAHTLARRHQGRWTRWHSAESPALAQLDAVAVDSSGQVWTGGLHGLARFDPDAGRAEVHRASSAELAVDWVTACAPWQGGLAVGTYNGGLSFFDGGRARIVRESDGLPAEWINPHAMRVLRGELWLGALDRGLVYGRPGAWKKLSLAQHLPSADVTAIEPAGATSAWIATRGGLARVEWAP